MRLTTTFSYTHSATRSALPQPTNGMAVSGFVGARGERGLPLAAVSLGISPRVSLRCTRGYVRDTPPGLKIRYFP